MSTDRRTRVIMSLQKTGVHVGVPKLLKGLRSENAKKKKVALQALIDFTGKDLGNDPEAWENWWLENQKDYVPKYAQAQEMPAVQVAPQPEAPFEEMVTGETQAIGPIPEDIATTPAPPPPEQVSSSPNSTDSAKMKALMQEWDQITDAEPNYQQPVTDPHLAIPLSDQVEALPLAGSEDSDYETKRYTKAEVDQVLDPLQTDSDYAQPPGTGYHPAPVPPPPPAQPLTAPTEFAPPPPQLYDSQPMAAPDSYPAPAPPPPVPPPAPEYDASLISDAEEQKIKEAVDWLEILGPREALPQLVEHVDHPNQFKQRRVLTILERLTSKNFGTDRKVWNSWWDSRQFMTFKQMREE